MVILLGYDLKCDQQTVALRVMRTTLSGKLVDLGWQPTSGAPFIPIAPEGRPFFDKVTPIVCSRS